MIGNSTQVVTSTASFRIETGWLTENGMNTGNLLFLRATSLMENRDIVELIHCFTEKKHAPDSLFGYLQYQRTTKPRIWRPVSLTLISLAPDWPTCALIHEIKKHFSLYRRKENIYFSPTFDSWLVNLASPLSLHR